MPRTSPKAEAASTSDPERLTDMAVHRHATVRLEVANNAATPDEALLVLIADADRTVRTNAAGEAIARPALHEALSRSDDKWVRAILAAAYTRRPEQGLAEDLQRRLAVDEFWETRGRIGETTSHLDIFEALLADPNPRVRAYCAGNPRLTRGQMDVLLADARFEVRCGAVGQGVVYPDEAQLARAARDRSANVRWNVIVRPGTPRGVLDLLIDDVDDFNRNDARRVRDGKLISPFIQAQARRRRAALSGFRFGDEVEVGHPPRDRSTPDVPPAPLDQHLVLFENDGATIAVGPDNVYRLFAADGSVSVVELTELQRLMTDMS